MANTPRSQRRDTTGPGRPNPKRPRKSNRVPLAEEMPAPAPEPVKQPPVWQRSLKITRRAVVLTLVLVAMLISFGSSLQIYLSQQHDLAVAQQEIRDDQAQIADLQAELDRWQDPDYVKAQARDRLGWVMPGEIGYRLVDGNGNLIGDGASLGSEQSSTTSQTQEKWWDRIWGSVQTADSPVRKVAKS